MLKNSKMCGLINNNEEQEEGVEQAPSMVYTSDDLIQEYIRKIEEKEVSREDTKNK